MIVKQSYKAVLTQHEYLKLICANIINRFGDSVDMIAFSILVYNITKSPTWVAFIFGCNALPNILIQPFAGALIENFNKKNIMIICDIARGLIVSLTAILFIFNLLNPWILLILTFLNSVFESFRIPAGIGIVPKILNKEHYTYGLSLNTSVCQTVQIIGMAIAGVIIGICGIGGAVIIDAITFIISGLIILFIKVEKEINKFIKPDFNKFKKDLVDGFVYLKQIKVLFVLCLLCAVINLLGIPINTMEAPFIQTNLRLGAFGFSVMGISLTAGSALGALIFPFMNKHFSNKTLLCVGGMLSGICYFLYIVNTYFTYNVILTYCILSISSFLFGLFSSMIGCVVSISFMKHVSDEFISRVGGIFNSFACCAMPIGSLMVGLLVTFLSVTQLFLFTGIFNILLFFGMLFMKTLNEL